MVSILFEFINLGLLLLLLFFVFKKYIYPGLKTALLENLDSKARLRHKKEELQEKQILLEREIKSQDERCKELMQKVNLWEEQIKTALNQKEAQKVNYYQRIKNRVAIQQENYKESKLTQELTPYIENHLYKSLNNYFEDKDHVDRYFENIINQIKETNNGY